MGVLEAIGRGTFVESARRRVVLACFAAAVTAASGGPARAILTDMTPAEIRAYLRTHPRDVRAAYELGKAYYRQGEYERAIRAWRHVLRYRPEAVRVWNRIGGACIRLGRKDAAIRVFEHVVDLDRRNVLARRALVVLYGQPGKPEEGTGPPPAPRVESPVDPRVAGEAAFNEGMQLFYGEAYEEAAVKFATALDAGVRVPACHLQIAECRLLEASRPGEAIAHYEAYLQMKPDDAKAYLRLGLAHGLAADVKAQIGAFERCIALDPQCDDAHFQLALAYDRLNDSPQTFRHAQTAIRLNPENKKRLQPLIKNSNVALKIGGIIDDVLVATRDRQLTDEEIERHARRIGKILGDENLADELGSAENREGFRKLMSDPEKVRKLQQRVKEEGLEGARDIAAEHDLEDAFDRAVERTRKRR